MSYNFETVVKSLTRVNLDEKDTDMRLATGLGMIFAPLAACGIMGTQLGWQAYPIIAMAASYVPEVVRHYMPFKKEL